MEIEFLICLLLAEFKFTKEAKEYVERLTSKKIILIDGYKLAEYMIDFNVGVTIQEIYEIKRIDSDYFEE